MNKGMHEQVSKSSDQDRFKSNIWLFIPTLILLLWCVGFLALLEDGQYWQFQENLFLEMNSTLSVLPDSFWHNSTLLGDAAILLPFIAFLTLSYKYRQIWVAILITAPITAIVSYGLKQVSAIPRPAAVLDVDRFNIIGSILTGHNSLPSGHTITAFAVVGVIIYLANKMKAPRYYMVVLLSVALAILVGLSRVVVGAHWPFDPIWGAFWGVICGYLGAYITCVYGLGKNCQYPKVTGLVFLFWGGGLLIRGVTSGSSDLVLWGAMICAFIIAALSFYNKKEWYASLTLAFAEFKIR